MTVLGFKTKFVCKHLVLQLCSTYAAIMLQIFSMLYFASFHCNQHLCFAFMQNFIVLKQKIALLADSRASAEKRLKFQKIPENQLSDTISSRCADRSYTHECCQDFFFRFKNILNVSERKKNIEI